MLNKLFGETQSEHGRVIYPILFTILLTSTTFFFFDYRTVHIFGNELHFSVGLIFFPLTFSISNMMQYRYGMLFANTAVRYGFLGDLLFVGIAWLLSHLGERQDYLSVYRELPTIMTLTFFFVWLSNAINFKLFSIMNGKVHHFFSFFVSCLIAECSVSFISVPLMMYQNHLNSSQFLSIAFIVGYKVVATLVLSSVMAVMISLREKQSNSSLKIKNY
ncbi:hypothetical protein SOPP22_01675 [Shewanella sp. OPT22]|nr:hypothetical protein SOPP22_01675 [Shewanella sp. OPT22]